MAIFEKVVPASLDMAFKEISQVENEGGWWTSWKNKVISEFDAIPPYRPGA